MTTYATEGPWYSALSRSQWNALIASNLGWLFDGFETYALILTAGVALRQLLDSSLHSQIPSYIGTTIAITLLGWGIGGMLGGILADYIGRKRMMIIAILAYSLAAGVSAFSFDWISFAIARFIVGIAIGSEWTTGSSMVSELWPAKLRGIGASLMQCGYGMGFFLASFLWMFVSSTGADAWRYMYFIGVLPALLTLWIRHGIPESEIWKETNKRRKLATKRKRDGELSEAEEKLTRFTLTNLFTDQNVR